MWPHQRNVIKAFFNIPLTATNKGGGAPFFFALGRPVIIGCIRGSLYYCQSLFLSFRKYVSCIYQCFSILAEALHSICYCIQFVLTIQQLSHFCRHCQWQGQFATEHRIRQTPRKWGPIQANNCCQQQQSNNKKSSSSKQDQQQNKSNMTRSSSNTIINFVCENTPFEAHQSRDCLLFVEIVIVIS